MALGKATSTRGAPPETSAEQRAGILRTACATLARSPSDEVSAIVVTLPVADLGSVLEIVDLCRRTGEVYGLDARVHLLDSWLSVRYTRRVG